MQYKDFQPSGDLRKDKAWEISRYLCPVCIENLVILKDDICPKCGAPLRASGCPLCPVIDFKFREARSVFLFDDKLKNLIHGLKYHRFLKIAPVLSAYASIFLENNCSWPKIDLVLPVPLHKVKRRERDFNQSALLGKWLAEFSHLEYREDLLLRNRYTETQTSLSPVERKKNVEGAFSLSEPEYLRDKTVLVVDDVFTTGSTCNSIARLLNDSQVRQVFVLTIARPS